MIISTDITKAVQILRNEGLVAFPTETVYGLGADASNPDAINKIFKAKGRPKDHPLIVHLAAQNTLTEWAEEISDAAYALAEAFWPGPLTLILQKKSHILDAVTGGQATIGLRVPRHPVALQLLSAFGGGIAGPSANRFTRVSPTTATAVYEELGNNIDLILDGGACHVGLESTIIDMSGQTPTILRPGMITQQAIEKVLGKKVCSGRASKIRTPGMHLLHYAPKTKTELISLEEIPSIESTFNLDELPVMVLTYQSPLQAKAQIDVTKMPSDPEHYARELYQQLRLVDKQHYKRIMIESVPESDEWTAIRDRIQKACGQR